jgi:hypothetical protein
MNTNKCCHLDLLLSGKTGRNAYNAELVNQDQAVPRHLDLPKLSELLKMRQNPADNDNEDDQENNKEQQAFTFLTEHLLGHVIGKRDWDIKRCFHRVSDYVSISDEAYTLLLCENVYEKWLKIKPPQAGEVQTVVRGKYTDQGNGASNKKYKGWTAQGIQRYNQLYQNVKQNRTEQWAKDIEMRTIREYQDRCKGRLVGTQIRQKKRKKQDWLLGDDDNNNEAHAEYPKAMNELEDSALDQQDSDSENEE